MKVSNEIAALFEGMTCRFEGVPFEFEVSYFRQTAKVIASPLVETVDGTRHLLKDCTKVFTSSSNPSGYYGALSFDWYTQEQLELAIDTDAISFCDEADCYAKEDYVRYCEHSGTCEHISDVTQFGDEWYLDSSGLLRTSGDGDTFLDGDDEYHYCSDGECWHESQCHYCDDQDEYVYGDSDDCEHCNPASPDRVYPYHRSGISPHIYRDFGGSGFAVGFEVEKNNVMGADSEGDHVDETDLFAYWETDASCGIEGITHAYDPLDPAMVSTFERHVSHAQDHLNADTDPTCGGHVNISSLHQSPRELMQGFRVFAPLWYAVYRNRLTNSYCHNDKKMEFGNDKYSPVITKSFGIEIRLPSRIKDADMLLRRFEWVGLTCGAIRDGATFNQYVKACRPLLFERSYGGNRIMYAKILRLARKFRIWMLDGIADQSIHQWV